MSEQTRGLLYVSWFSLAVIASGLVMVDAISFQSTVVFILIIIAGFLDMLLQSSE